ncbi:ATPase family AAA domain-containing protein 3B like [Verticillium longisporum]|uniref:ATPase family AAA domain-containing protein 3B like n=1 Tax=Verticillium longisporum TaxID=100787 RepID=A0A8I2Z969_VERLO|nr:ATPase family AAA domain-containing protein 3B like [Verticillium longisporum]
MDQSRETSRFIAYLLDTIQLLQTKLSYARAPEPDDTLDRSDLLDDTITQPHSHSGFIFEDEPKTLTDVNTGIMLSGKAKIANLESYLVKRPDICLVVFKRHDCISSEKTLKTDKASKLNERDEWLKGDYGQDYEEADELLTHGYITAKHITKLYKPNHMVLSRQARGALEAYVLGKFPEIDKDAMAFQGWSWQYDGTELSRKEWSDTMNRVAEEERIAIADLSIHPIEFARGSDIETLDTRGRQFWDLRKQVYKCYTGWDKSRSNNYVDARFMVDVSSYQLMHRAGTSHPRYDRDLSPFDKWPTRIDRSEENLPPSTIMLLPATIYGFSFQEKKWVNLNVENFFPVNWNKKAFERLVLDPKTKEMIYALVDVQSSAEKMDDIIKGKGNGLIVLLHGSPGTGKTLTTESVAEIAEKPLYRVTCGDIGTDAKEVEDYLQTVLHLGKIWDCVLLLDEADVFLEERTMADLQRNSLVTVFLRVLEYYEGILMLTSNRVGTFDEAFKSRIQVAIHYDNLSKKARKAIWRNFFDMIEDSPHEDVNMPELERRLDELAAEEMNGRQIRNALRTARQLAKHRNERLDWPHLSQVIKTSGAFNKYLKAVRGHSDDQWAREEMIR